MASKRTKTPGGPRGGVATQALLLPGAAQVTTRRIELGPGGRLPGQLLPERAAILDVVAGERILSLAGRRRVVRAGDRVIVPPNGCLEIADPQGGIRDGPFVFVCRLVCVGPLMGRPRGKGRRIVAVRRDAGGRILRVRYDDGTVRSIEEAVEDADHGLVAGVHTVRPRRGRPYLRVHWALKDEMALEQLPSFEEWERCRE